MNDGVLIHVPISNRAWALPSFWRGLSTQVLPGDLRSRTTVLFDLNDSQDATGELLRVLSKSAHGFETVLVRETETGHIALPDHRWSPERLARMTRLRNGALHELRLRGKRWLFSIDSDVVLTEPDTLAHLLSLDVTIVAAVFHAKWGNPEALALPNVWLCGRNEMSIEFLDRAKQPGHFEVGGLGACTLIRYDVAVSGVTYDPVYNAPSNYNGEDRFFCLRAAVAGYRMLACSCKRVVHLDRALGEVYPWGPVVSLA
jgi:hypothetical protein